MPAWVPVCENCGAFDTLDWKTPPHAEDAGLADSAMLPLIIGSRSPSRTRRKASGRAGTGGAARASAEPAPTSTTPSSPTSPTRPAPAAADRLPFVTGEPPLNE